MKLSPLFPLLVTVALPLAAHQGHETTAWQPTPYADKLAHAPRPLPDRIVLTWSGDPATTQSVTWRTDTSIVRALAEIAIANENGRDLKPQSVPARTELFKSDLGEAPYHNVTFTELTPDLLYAYRVGDGSEAERKWTTKDDRTIAVTVALKADKDAAGKTTRTRIYAKSADGQTGVITLGDDGLITAIDAGIARITGYAEADLVAQQPDKRPLHDRIANPGTRTLSHHWRPSFTLPEQGAPAGLEEACYTIDYQSTRIISLESNRLQKEQIPWLREVLKSNPHRWTVVTFHHPIFSPANNRDNPELRAAWKPIFDEFKVDLVLTGHDHTYARSGDISGRGGSINIPAGYNQAYDPAIGTVYVVSVSGPKMYNVTTDFAVRSAEDTQLYQIIHVDRDEIRYEARTAIGRLYDAFTLKKRAGRANELIETLPPERRRAPAGAAKKITAD